MSHPLDEVQNTPWGKEVDEKFENLQKQIKDGIMPASVRPQNGRNGGWRFSKDIPVSVVGFIILQTILLTYFLAGQNAKLEAVVADNASNKSTQYTKEDARHEREFIEQKFLLMQNKLDEDIRRITSLEAQVNEVKARTTGK